MTMGERRWSVEETGILESSITKFYYHFFTNRRCDWNHGKGMQRQSKQAWLNYPGSKFFFFNRPPRSRSTTDPIYVCT